MLSQISIIVPIYNSGDTLNRCIESLISQTHSDVEIILVNDGSTDDSLEICGTWAKRDNRIKVLSQPNMGVSEARNNGIRHSSGEYLMFLDSDDYMYPEMCEVMCNTIVEKKADCVICGCKETGGGEWKPICNRDYISAEEFNTDFLQLLHTELLSPVWNKVFKRSLITELFQNGVSFGEDLIFNLSYFRNCSSISFIPNVLLYHEKDVDGSLVMTVNIQRLKDIERVQNSIMNYIGTTNLHIFDKYVRDLCVYARMYLKSTSLHDVSLELNEWRNNSNIDNLHVCELNVCWQNKILLSFLRKRFWIMAIMLVRKNILICR